MHISKLDLSVIGPLNTLFDGVYVCTFDGVYVCTFDGVYVCTFQPGNFTCWGREGVKLVG